MNDERFQRTVGSWLRDEDPAPPDSLRSASRVAARLPKVRQQSRWWPLPLLRGTPARGPTIPDTLYQPSPVPASNGHTPTVIGRTQAMLSPAKAITAGALVIAVGGAFLVAQPFGQEGGSVPGAPTDRAGLEPAYVSGTLSGMKESNHDAEFYAGDFYALDDDSVLFTRAQWDEAGRLMMNDPRITGDWSGAVGINRYRPPGSSRVSHGAETYTGTITVENDAGAWVGTLLGCSGCGQREMRHVELVGTGAYEGLSALLYSGANDGLYGVIVPDDLSPEESEDLGAE